MGNVAVVGVGHTKFGSLGRTLKELFAEAAFEAFSSVDRNFDPSMVQEAFVGSISFGGGQIGNLSALMTEHCRLVNVPVRRVENACASSGFAFRDAFLAVRSGVVDVALAGGIEIMNDLTSDRQRYWLGVSGDTEWERLAGLTFPGVYALIANRHMHEFGTKREQLGAVAVKNHGNGAKNPKAQFQREIRLEDHLSAPMVAYPLGLYDCCPTSDGATCAIVASAEKAREFTDTPVWVKGSGAASDFLAVHDRAQITTLAASRRASATAYNMASIEPKDIDVAEVHDCFTIAEILAMEDLGFVEKGQGGPFVESGATALGGQVSVNTSGGLKSKGHPLGATGTSQVYEIFKQLRNQADRRQVSGAELGLTHNVGGSGATCAVHLFSL